MWHHLIIQYEKLQSTTFAQCSPSRIRFLDRAPLQDGTFPTCVERDGIKEERTRTLRCNIQVVWIAFELTSCCSSSELSHIQPLLHHHHRQIQEIGGISPGFRKKTPVFRFYPGTGIRGPPLFANNDDSSDDEEDEEKWINSQWRPSSTIYMRLLQPIPIWTPLVVELMEKTHLEIHPSGLFYETWFLPFME